VEAELVKGDNGVFDVFADGRLVFSKDEKGRFPNADGEVLALLASGPRS
jgi:predicted Rdx family selenoprotein